MIGTMGYLNQFRHSCHIDFFLAPGFRRCCGRLLRVSQLFCSTKITYVTESKILKVAIIGPPNAGKSTIINQIVGRRVINFNIIYFKSSGPIELEETIVIL